MKDEHVNDAAQGAVEDVPQDMAQDLGFGPGRRAPSPPRHRRRRPVVVQFALRWGRNWAASSVAFGSGCGQTLPGVPRKAPLCLLYLVSYFDCFKLPIG